MPGVIDIMLCMFRRKLTSWHNRDGNLKSAHLHADACPVRGRVPATDQHDSIMVHAMYYCVEDECGSDDDEVNTMYS